MIEINLIPDIKQDYLKAKRARTVVASGAILGGIISIAIVILLAVYLFGVQTIRSSLADSEITKKSDQLQAVPDLENMLTVQSQLANLTELHEDKNIDSRLISLLKEINPSDPNQVTYSQVSLDTEKKTIHIEAQADNAFVAADAFKKTIQAMKFQFKKKGSDTAESRPVVSKGVVAISNQSYGENTVGKKVLRFSIDFVYDTALFASSSTNVVVTRPDRQNATDSFKHLPASLFGARAVDTEEPN